MSRKSALLMLLSLLVAVIRLRAVSFAQRGTCGWAPQLLLPRTVDATWGLLHAPMVMRDDYVYTPDMGTLYRASTMCRPDSFWGDDCGSVQLHFSCAGPSEISFDIDVSAQQGQNRVWIGVNSQDTVAGGPPPSHLSPFTIQRTPQAGPSCDSVGGIRGGDVCCPAACGRCGGYGCGQLPGPPIPGDPAQHSSCCVGSVTASERVCDPASADGMAPCNSPDPFEWRTYGDRSVARQIFVEGGEHTLEIYHGKAGAKIRNVRFHDRGSCGFTDTRSVDPAAVSYATSMCQAQLGSLTTSCPGGSPVPGLTLSLPSVCTAGCAGEFISYHADCRDLLQASGTPGGALRTLDQFLDSCNTAPPSPPDVPALSMDECTAQFSTLNDACCSPAKYCSSGIPSRCTSTCVDPYLALHRDCLPALRTIACAADPANCDDIMASYDRLADMCVVTMNHPAGGGH